MSGGEQERSRKLLSEGENRMLKRIHLSPSFSAALAGALAFGLMAHGMGLFNKLSWHDDIFSLFMTGNTVSVGRWMLHVFSQAELLIFGNGHFSLPLFNGLISLICIGVSAGLTADYFQIRSRPLAAASGAVMAVFPAVTALFGFMFTIHYYMTALLMMTAGGLLICGEGGWWKKAAGVLLCGCSVGVYQAFLPVLPTLVLMDQIMVLCKREEKAGFYLKRLLIRALCAAGAMAVYFAGNRLFLRLEQTELENYLGISQAGSTTLGTYLERAGTAYREFFRPTRDALTDMYPQRLYYVYLLLLALSAALGIGWVIRTWKKNPARACLLAGSFALIPLGCNFVFVMSGEVHSLMVYGQVMAAVLAACLADWTELSLPRFRRAGAAAAGVILAVLSILYVRYDNICYLKAGLQQQEAISWYTTLVTRIESTEGFRDELPVAYINRDNMQDRNLYMLDEMDFIQLAAYDVNTRGYLNNWAWEEFLARWCGFAPETVDPEQVKEWPEVKEMPSYPDEGSIRVIRDVLVVHF